MLILQYTGSLPRPQTGSVGARFLGKYLALEASYAPKNKCKCKRKEKATSTNCAITSSPINKDTRLKLQQLKYTRKGQLLNDTLVFFNTLWAISAGKGFLILAYVI